MSVADVVSVIGALTALVTAIATLVRSWRLRSAVEDVRKDVAGVKDEHAAMRDDLGAFEEALEKTGAFQRPTGLK
ncbi:MAG TPA: hypothetical protein VFJ25_04630 [Casimicrobiaceae bacterium]|nr:hypothetical protein [Casimicrobiaceae bacterium]